MNIFQVLSQGKSRLHEPSMSAMLGYLLDSNKEHGLGDTFIRAFIKLLDEDKSEDTFKKMGLEKALMSSFIDSQVSLEEPYDLNGSRKDIDIQISILDKQKNEIFRFIIENKIKSSSANHTQLQEYYQAITNDDNTLKNLVIVFLTPNVDSKNLKKEYDNLVIPPEITNHHKFWITWDSDTNSIISILKMILTKEIIGDINPINEYVRHTLKAFTQHCISINTKNNSFTLAGEDIGDIVDEAYLETTTGKYKVVIRDSGQIQVFNAETDEKEIARRVLGQFINENNLDINIGKDTNTRQIGKRIFDLYNGKKDRL